MISIYWEVHYGSVIQKVVPPIARHLSRLRVSIAVEISLWVWSRRRRKYTSHNQSNNVKLGTEQVQWIFREKNKGELTNAQIRVHARVDTMDKKALVQTQVQARKGCHASVPDG